MSQTFFEELTKRNISMAERLDLPRFYKVVRSDGISTHRRVEWSLPGRNKPGDWMHARGRLKLCGNGIHALRLCDIRVWMYQKNYRLYEIELNEGCMLHGSNKVVSPSGRLVRLIDFKRDWSYDKTGEFYDSLHDYRLATQGRLTRPDMRDLDAAAAALQMLVGRRERNVNGMIEQLVVEQLVA